MAYTFETTYSFNEVTKPAPLKVGDKVRYNTYEMGTTSGWKKLTNAPTGTVLKSPKGDIVIREGSPSKTTTFYSHNGGAHTFQSGYYKVLDVPDVKPEAPKADPVGDLVVELGKARWGSTWSDKDDAWARGDAQHRKQAEWVRSNFIRTGTKVIVDNYGDTWFQLKNGNYSLIHNRLDGGMTRDWIRGEYGIRHEFTLR